VTLTTRDRRALVALAVAGVAIIVYLLTSGSGSTPAAQVVSLNSTQLRQRLVLLRQTAAVLPAREAVLKQTEADLADRERGIIQAGTAAEAQSELLQTAVRLGKANDLEVRSSDFGAPKVFGDYGIVYATVSFDCHVEQLLNFLADLTREPQLIVPSEERVVASGNPKDKTMNVRMVLAGVVAKKLIPEKKALGAF
jgi:hypothetical protein